MAARLLRVPAAPFVHIERDLLGGVILVHHRADVGYKAFHLQRQRQLLLPAILAKAGGRALGIASVRHGVVMEAQRLQAAAILHHRLGKALGVAAAADIAGGAAGHLDHVHGGRRIDEGRVAGIDRRRLLAIQVAAAAPGLVADAQIFEVPGLAAAILAPLIGQRGLLAGGHVFDPLRGVIRRQRADIDRDIGIGADQFGEVHEFMGAEAVVVGDAAPMDIDARGAPGARADAVAPVVEIGETAARPAHHGNMDRLQRLHHVLAIAMDVGDRALFAHPDAAVNSGAQMLGELAIDMAVNLRPGPGCIHRDLDLRRLRHCRQRNHQRRTQNRLEHRPPRFCLRK